MPFNSQLQPGQFVRFTYKAPKTQDIYKEVMVLQPSWHNQMHGIDLKRITPAETGVLKVIMDPEAAKQKGKHPYPLVNDILNRMDPIEDIKNPMSFYQRFVRPFLHGKDAYRIYDLSRVFGVQVIKESHVAGAVINPAPLFKKD